MGQPSLEENLPLLWRMNELICEIDSAYHQAARRLDLSDSAMQVLYALVSQQGQCLFGQVCRLSGLGKQTVHSALKKLEREGFLRLESAGGRQKRVCLTPEGRRLTGSAILPLMAAESRVLSQWSREDIQTYLSLIQRYLTEFQRELKELKREPYEETTHSIIGPF